MRKVILYMQITLDGFLTGPNRELDWMVPIEDEKSIEMDVIDSVDTALIGHGSYPEMSEHWTAAEANPATPKDEAEGARKINNINKLIFSTTEEKMTWKNARQVLVQDNKELAEAVGKLKTQPGRDMVLFGGAGLAQTFAELGLIDEYRLVVHPVVLGNGTPLFKNGMDRMNLKLLLTKTDPSGVILLCYAPEQP